MSTAPYYFYMETSNVLNSYLKYLYDSIYVNTNNLIKSVNASISTSDNNNDIFNAITSSVSTLNTNNEAFLLNIQQVLASSNPLNNLSDIVTDLTNINTDYVNLINLIKNDYFQPDLTSSSSLTAIVRMSSSDQNALYGITNKLGQILSILSSQSQSFQGGINLFLPTILEPWVNIINDVNTNAESLTYNSMDLLENVNLLQKAWTTFGATGITVSHNNTNLSTLISDVVTSLSTVNSTLSNIYVCLENAVTNIYDYMARLGKLKPGQVASVEIIRNEKKQILIVQF